MSEESMTPDLVEHVRAILEAADRADFDSILAFYAPDAVWELGAGDDARAAAERLAEERA
jgi:ketosteroid isomerase-like protein